MLICVHTLLLACYFMVSDTILLLFDASIILDEGVASVLLQLLQCALCQPANQGSKDKKSEKENTKETKKENTQG